MSRTDPASARGNQVYEPRRVCRCSHAEVVHELTAKKIRTVCSHGDATGPCGCRLFEEAS